MVMVERRLEICNQIAIESIRPVVAENIDLKLLVYSRRPREPMQEQD